MSKNVNPNSVQYGGDHYKKAGDKQHWDMVAAFGYGWEYYLARASAYLTRVKDQELDPKKAGHFLDKLLNLVESGKLPPTFTTTQRKRLNIEPGVYADQVDVEAYLAEYFQANHIDPASDEATAISILSNVRTTEDVRAARTVIARIAGDDDEQVLQQAVADHTERPTHTDPPVLDAAPPDTAPPPAPETPAPPEMAPPPAADQAPPEPPAAPPKAPRHRAKGRGTDGTSAKIGEATDKG